LNFFQKIIKMQGLRLCFQLLYFLHQLDLVFHTVRDYPLPLEQISLDILIDLQK
jgi:hypothetical protein